MGIMVELVVQSIDPIEKQEERIINSKRMSDYLYDRKRQKKSKPAIDSYHYQEK